MLRFFRSSYTIVLVVIILVGGMTWFHALLAPEELTENRYGTFLFAPMTGWFNGIPLLSICIGLVLTLLGAMMMIVVNNRLHLIDKISYLPALCYVLLVGGVPFIHQFNPASIASILLILGFIQLIESFESERLSYGYFTASLFISIATFFYQYMYLYMLVVWFAILFLRPGYWREWVFSLLGFAFPVFLAFSWYFLVEDDFTRMGVFFHDIFAIQRTIPALSVSTVAFIGISTLVGIFTFGYLLRYLGSKKIVVRNGYYILILIAIITVAMAVIVPDTLPLSWYLMVFPLSFILSSYLATVRSYRWGTIVLAVLFLGVVISQLIFLSQPF